MPARRNSDDRSSHDRSSSGSGPSSPCRVRRCCRALGAASLVVLLCGGALVGCSSVDVLGTRADDLIPIEDLGYSRDQVNERLNDAFNQLFFGDAATSSIFRDLGTSGYVEDINNHDVRTDSMGYGMLVTAQLNQRRIFDKLWGWTKAHMLSKSGPTEGLLHWRCDTQGEQCTPVAATDSSSVIVTSLFMAATRWTDPGEHDYGTDALRLLDAMLSVEERNGGTSEGVYDLFDKEYVLPRFSSEEPHQQVDTEYLMPAFYEIWAGHDPSRSTFWRQMAHNSRALLSKMAHAETGLYPAAISYDGGLVAGRDYYAQLTSRSYLNLALDQIWFGPFEWIVEQNERRLDFFLEQGVSDYVTSYTLDGRPLLDFNDGAHMALVALMAGTSQDEEHRVFLRLLLETPIPTGTYRYYTGMMFILSLLVLSGQMTPG